LGHASAERVTIMWLTSGLFHHAVELGLERLDRLRFLLAGGDVLSGEHVRRARDALPRTTLVNGYGPTENTTFTCCYAFTEAPGPGSVPIGTAIRGTEVYVLDDRLRPAADGAVGELYATGRGLAHGYLGRPDATAARFVADPFAAVPGNRMYRTGDLVRRRTDGNLEFLGRRDGQVKIRGFRVETDEVLAALLEQPRVAQAAVVAKGTTATDRRLIAYVTAESGLSVLTVRRGLADRLPDYAIPSLIRVLDALPLTPNGKVDRAALQRLPDAGRPAMHARHREPESPLERRVVELWSDLLGVHGIGADDDFFELGGHSLLAITILGEVRRTHGVEVTPLDFYLDPTPAGLTRAIAKGGAAP
jgi:acyl-coenzyme A synthetase/AMP-(fatty) acid ligase